jgi:hypothetical protein
MKKLFFLYAIFAGTFISCKKESSSTATNKAPVANAGRDTTIRLPVDSAVLDGSSSYDPDGRIASYLWRQIAGPSAADILDTDKAKGKAKLLVQGIYSFELKIGDNNGSFSTDTVDVRVLSLSGNIIANAGPDKVITLPVMEAPLEASGSRDPSGLPLTYQWRHIAGPACQIRNTLAVTTSVVFSTAGVYQFELKVSNTNGIAYDTTQVTVNEDRSCTVSRTEMPAQLTHLKQFTFSSHNTAKLLAVGNKLLIPVDVYDPIAVSAVIIYNVATKTYTEKELSFPRLGAATAVAGNKVFFAGGFTNFDDDERPRVTDVVDIYDAASNTWSTAKLSQARGAVKAGVVGNKVVFAGGLKSNVLSNQVDIYDLETAQWTTSQLAGEPRAIERVVADGSNIYFLGGFTAWENPTGFGFTLTTASKTIDIYNVASGTWSRSNMQVERYNFSAVLVNDKILIAGGLAGVYPNEGITSNVEIITLPTMQRSSTCLATATAWYGVEATALKNGSVIFYLGGGAEKRKFNIYNPQTGAWSLGVHAFDVLGQNEPTPALATLNGQVYVLQGNTLYTLHY